MNGFLKVAFSYSSCQPWHQGSIRGSERLVRTLQDSEDERNHVQSLPRQSGKENYSLVDEKAIRKHLCLTLFGF